MRLNLGKILPQPQAGLAKSFLFGGRKNLSFELKNKIRRVGLSHIVAVSGMHLAFIAGFVAAFNTLFSANRYFGFFSSLSVILVFVIMADFTPSVVRALVMTFLFLLSRLKWRIYNPINAVLFAAFAMTVLEPKIIFDDLGFQLSFLAILGIIYFYPLFEKYSFWQKEIFKSPLRVFKEAAILSFSSLILVFPWIVFKTGAASLVGPFANVLIVPLVPYVMILGLITALLSFIFYPLAIFIGFYLNLLLILIVGIIQFLSSLSFSEIYLPFGFRYLFLAFYFFPLWYIYKKDRS